MVLGGSIHSSSAIEQRLVELIEARTISRCICHEKRTCFALYYCLSLCDKRALLYIFLMFRRPPAKTYRGLLQHFEHVCLGGRSLGECRGIHFRAEGVGTTPS